MVYNKVGVKPTAPWRFTIVIALWAITAFMADQSAALAEELNGTAVSVVDGDTLDLLVGTTRHRIRLSEIDTPERDQPWGAEAAAALKAKVEGRAITVVVVDTDIYNRRVGKIWLDGRDINRELVREGHAWVYRQYLLDSTLLDDERLALDERSGLWQRENPVAPWLWRRQRVEPQRTEGR